MSSGLSNQGIGGVSNLDHIDAAIIDLLQQDGRLSAVEIAEQLGNGLSPRVVRYRINRLCREGKISVVAVLHATALGYPVKADVVVEAEPGTVRELAKQLSEIESVTYVSLVTGDRDISIQVVARSLEELYDFVLDLPNNFPNVRRTQTYLLPRTLKFSYSWKLPREVVCHEAVEGEGSGSEPRP